MEASVDGIKLRLAYLDESGTEGEEGWFILTGFIINSNDWQVYDKLWRGVPNEVREQIDNLKELRHPSTDLGPEERHEASMKIYEIINHIGYRAISVIVHQPAATNFCSVDQIYEMAFSFLMERFEYLLSEVNELGVVFVDERDDKTPLRLQEVHYELKREGTHFANFERTIGAAAPLREEESIPMSMADWIGSAIRNYYLRDNPDYYEKVHQNMQRNPKTNKILGAGIKLIPDDRIEELRVHPDRIEFT